MIEEEKQEVVETPEVETEETPEIETPESAPVEEVAEEVMGEEKLPEDTPVTE
uniref:Uncharacterized protein n=1 Tax=viral metagenome TaxID=1070528 RepID=A0A6H1ZC65_9ZZZZ